MKNTVDETWRQTHITAIRVPRFIRSQVFAKIFRHLND